MTVLWGSLLVAGIVMIAVAVWPSGRGRDRGRSSADTDDPDGV